LSLNSGGRVLLLDAGRLVAEGDVATILSDSALMLEHGLEVPARYRQLVLR
jgi:ABC-type hemin transport system ATPase subunit